MDTRQIRNISKQQLKKALREFHSGQYEMSCESAFFAINQLKRNGASPYYHGQAQALIAQSQMQILKNQTNTEEPETLFETIKSYVNSALRLFGQTDRLASKNKTVLSTKCLSDEVETIEGLLMLSRLTS